MNTFLCFRLPTGSRFLITDTSCPDSVELQLGKTNNADRRKYKQMPCLWGLSHVLSVANEDRTERTVILLVRSPLE